VKDDCSFSLLKVIGSLSADGLFIYDMQAGSVEFVNEPLLKMLEIPKESLLHHPQSVINNIIPEDQEHFYDALRTIKEQCFIENVTLRLRTAGNITRFLSAKVYKVDNVVIGYIEDITQVREHEEYITNYGAKKNVLLDMIAHNLSAPLILTNNILTSLQKSMGAGDKDNLEKHLQIIGESTDHCIDIINDFLQEEHFTSEYIFVKRIRFDVIGKVNNMLERMRRSYGQKNFVLITDVTTLYVESDEVKFMQIVQNLLSNAAKFTRPNGRIEVLVGQRAKTFSLSVKDNGIGIPTHLQSLIFEKYTPAGRPGVSGERSIGMGLFIARKLVSILNGKLTFESTENAGSIFTVEFMLE
jgi:two-component system, OmpR family, sensor histidine kinase VicK